MGGSPSARADSSVHDTAPFGLRSGSSCISPWKRASTVSANTGALMWAATSTTGRSRRRGSRSAPRNAAPAPGPWKNPPPPHEARDLDHLVAARAHQGEGGVVMVLGPAAPALRHGLPRSRDEEVDAPRDDDVGDAGGRRGLPAGGG